LRRTSVLGLENGYVTRKVLDRGLILTMIVCSVGLAFLTRFCGAWRGVDVRTTWTFSVFGFSLLAMICASLVGVCASWSGGLGFLTDVLQSKSAVYLGTVSYTMYLIHLPSYVVVQLVMGRFFGPDAIASSRVLPVVCGVLATACTIALAALSWKYIETPILRMKEKRFPVAPVSRTLPVMETAIT
jgi:peptidoglycan/LPS O-acetylase OafA/YrhL